MKHLEKVNYKGFIWPLVVGIVLWLITPWRPSGLNAQDYCGMYHKAVTNWWYNAFRYGCYRLSWTCSS